MADNDLIRAIVVGSGVKEDHILARGDPYMTRYSDAVYDSVTGYAYYADVTK